MVELEEDVSPASRPQIQWVTWSNEIKATNTRTEDDGRTVIFESGNYRYCRSEQEFESGSHRYEIEVNWGGKQSDVSFGVCYDGLNFRTDSGVYYFTNAYIYCNYYPSFTNHYTNIHNQTPPKLAENQTVAVNFDFDEKKIWWEINGQEYEKLSFDTQNKPAFLVVGTFAGTIKFV